MRGFVAIIALLAATLGYGRWICLDPAVETLNIHLRVRAHSGEKFGFDVAVGDTMCFRRIEAEMPGQWPDDVNNSMNVKIRVSTHCDGGVADDTTMSATIFSTSRSSTDISIRLVGRPGNALLEAGAERAVFSFPISFADTARFFVRENVDRSENIVRKTFEYEPRDIIRQSEFANLNELREHLGVSTDPYEGMWMFYDRTVSPLKAAANGEYVLATVKRHDHYDIIFIADRENIVSPWREMMVKGTMKGCDVPGVFDVVWYDRSMSRVKTRVSAVFEEPFITFSFPFYSTSLRFSRVSAF